MLKLGSCLWTSPTCWISFIKLKVFLLLLVHRYGCGIFSTEYSLFWWQLLEGLATHLSNLCYGMLQEGQCILHVGWISQHIKGCKYPFNSFPPAHHPLWQRLEPSWRNPFSSQFLPPVWLGMKYQPHTEKKRKCWTSISDTMQHLSELHNQTCIRVVLQRDNFIRVKQIVPYLS